MTASVVPTVDEITRASDLLDPLFAHSPLLRSTPLDGGGATVALKVETLNPIRSFKGRGATVWMRAAGAETAGVVCASVGNFGQGLAYAASNTGVPCTVFVGASANPAKVVAIRALGAEVKTGGPDYDTAIDTARAFAEERGLSFVQDGRDRWIAAGAATMAVEVTEAGYRPDVVLVPVGNSALILGIARWLRHAQPGVQVVGVCAEQAPAPALSWRAGSVVGTPSAATVADGIAVRVPFPEAVAAMSELVDDMVLVSEAELREGTRWLADRLGLLVEAAGAAGVAALRSDPGRWRGRVIWTPLCGGHLPPEAFSWSTAWQS
ncbi:MAG: pyridoxal-phosphate dependent enzyme [Actinomycetota bacterium]|nr:pyridoxal-phosphate dependent enzyme [Actinomycetota bacterium]